MDLEHSSVNVIYIYDERKKHGYIYDENIRLFDHVDRSNISRYEKGIFRGKIPYQSSRFKEVDHKTCLIHRSNFQDDDPEESMKESTKE